MKRMEPHADNDRPRLSLRNPPWEQRAAGYFLLGFLTSYLVDQGWFSVGSGALMVLMAAGRPVDLLVIHRWLAARERRREARRTREAPQTT